MKVFQKATDGGEKSGVHAYFLIEWKGLFSIALLRFSPGSREAFHSHAFNACSWLLLGLIAERTILSDSDGVINIGVKHFRPSLRPKFTPRSQTHKVISLGVSWMLTVRGPWADTWREYREDEGWVTLTHGRRVVA